MWRSWQDFSRLGQIALGRLARVVEQALETQGPRGRHVLGLDVSRSFGPVWLPKNGAFQGKILGKSWEKLGRIIGKSWENLGRIIGKSWEFHKKMQDLMAKSSERVWLKVFGIGNHGKIVGMYSIDRILWESNRASICFHWMILNDWSRKTSNMAGTCPVGL